MNQVSVATNIGREVLQQDFSGSAAQDVAEASGSSSQRTRRPDLLLQPYDGINPLASIRTVHASTLFSGGAIINGEINPEIVKEFTRARAQGVSAFYVPGMWEATAFSELWTRHWAPRWEGADKLKPQWIGASTFSTDAYEPNHLIGSWDNLDRVLTVADRIGLTIVPCFVTNTIGLGGSLMREALRSSPESIMSRMVDRREFEYLVDFARSHGCVRRYVTGRNSGPSDGLHSLELFKLSDNHDLYVYRYLNARGELHEAYLQIQDQLYKHAWIVDRCSAESNEVIHCIQLGSEDPFDQGDGSATVWSDTAHRSVHLSETRAQQMSEMRPVFERFGNIRCDMAHLAGPLAWSDYPALIRAQGREPQRMLLETYFEHGGLLQQDPAISVYGNFIYKWLVNEDMNIPSIMWHIHDDRRLYEQHRVVAYVENHDDKGTTYLPVKGAQALIIAASPVESILWGQNQRVGDEFRIGAALHLSRADVREREKAILMGEDPQAQGNRAYLQFFRRIERLSALPVFRSAQSSWHRAEFNAVAADPERIFHIVRELPGPDPSSTDRVLVVVDARHSAAGQPLDVDVLRSFKIEERDLYRYQLVDLISGSIKPATATLRLAPAEGSPSPHSYAYALVLA